MLLPLLLVSLYIYIINPYQRGGGDESSDITTIVERNVDDGLAGIYS